MSISLLPALFLALFAINIGCDAQCEDGCYVDGTCHKVGDTWPDPLGQCSQSTCFAPNSISKLNCPLIMVSPTSNCTITETDYSKQYPDCCPQAMC